MSLTMGLRWWSRQLVAWIAQSQEEIILNRFDIDKYKNCGTGKKRPANRSQITPKESP
jgi:hypothetical protein